MKTTILSLRNSMNRLPVCAFVLIPVVLGCIAFSPQARAGTPPLDGNYPNQNIAEGDDALLSVTTGADDTAMGSDPLYRNITGSDNALASWVWRGTRRLNKGHYLHTATLLQDVQVLVAEGIDGIGHISANAELYDRASETWSAAGSLNIGRVSHTATLLQNGMVLVAGEVGITQHILASAELRHDPLTSTGTRSDLLAAQINQAQAKNNCRREAEGN